MSSLETWGLAAATLGAVGLLVADSAAPSCEVYRGFQVEYDWTTDCMIAGKSASGHVALSLPDASSDEGDSQALAVQAASGGLALTAAWVSYSEQGCTETDGSRGTGTATGLQLVVARGTPMTAELYCSVAQLDAVDQRLDCSPSSTPGGATCTLTLHRTSP